MVVIVGVMAVGIMGDRDGAQISDIPGAIIVPIL